MGLPTLLALMLFYSWRVAAILFIAASFRVDEVHRVADLGAPPAGALTPGHDLLRRSQWASAFADSELPSILAGRLGEETRSGQAAATIFGVQLSVSRRFV